MKKLLWLFFVSFFIVSSVIHAQPQIPCQDQPDDFPLQIDHLSPLCQGQTNTCWAFATISFLETELMRQTGKRIRLSPMWVVYHAHLEKARNYYQKYGRAHLSGGGLPHDVLAIIRKYGIVPFEAYPGRTDSSHSYHHRQLDLAVENLMRSIIRMEDISLDFALMQLKEILDNYLGTPPDTLEIDGKKITPNQYAQDILKLQLDVYIEITSFQSFPFFTTGELKLPDNWMQYDQYLNVPLNRFTDLLNQVLKKGFSVVIDMDLTERDYQKDKSLATLTISRDSLNQTLRETWFEQRITTDDHLQHLIGYAPCADENGFDWYLIKDSLPSSINSPSAGYIYMREDYLKMKVLSFMVHRDAVKKVLQEHFPLIFK